MVQHSYSGQSHQSFSRRLLASLRKLQIITPALEPGKKVHVQVQVRRHADQHVLPSVQLGTVHRLHDLLTEGVSSDEVESWGENTVLL